MAKIAPSCITTLNILVNSVSGKPMTPPARIICPVDDTGINSVTPSTMAITMALNIKSHPANVLGLLYIYSSN